MPGPRPEMTAPTRVSLPWTAGPFAPQEMRIYPLTHLAINPDGEAEIVLHLELSDRWGDTIKGVGYLVVALLRPGGLGDLSAGTGVAELRWEIDLRDPATSTGYFDPATRTYRISLTGLPGWVEEMARRPPGGDDGAQRLILRAMFQTVGDQGQRLELEDDHAIRR